LSPVFIHISDDRWPVRPALGLAAYRRFTSEQLASPAGIEAILGFLESHRVHGITCLSDEMALRLNALRGRMSSTTMLWAPQSRVIRFLSSKSAQIGLARQVGLATLPSFAIRRSIAEVPDDARFPMVARPDGPGAVAPPFKAAFIASRDQLQEFVDRFDRISRPIILQRFVAGPNLVVHGYRGAGGLPMNHVGFLVERKFEGVALTIRPVTLEPGIREKCAAFCNELDIIGCYHFDFIQDVNTNITYFLELNGRLGGTTAKAFACGYDEPANLLAAHGVLPDKPFYGGSRWRPCSNRLSLAKYLLHLAAGWTTPLDYPSMSFHKALAVIGCGALWWRDEIFSSRELKSSLSYYGQWILDKLPASRAKGIVS
jgi:hypothetical protein